MAAAAVERVDPGDNITLDPNEIDLGPRLRPIDAAFATAIGESMRREGQIHPVDVRPTADGSWQLAGAGGHRVTGARLAGIPIEARVVLFDQSVSRRREAAENLFRRANDPLERAEAIAELVRLHREQAGSAETVRRDSRVPATVREEAAGMCDTMSHIYGWADEVAVELGFSKRTVQRDLFLYRSLKASVVQLLRDYHHPVLKSASQLRALAKLEGRRQVEVVQRLHDGLDPAKSVAEAIRQISGSNSVAQSAEDRRLSAFIGAFSRMSLAEKKGALAQLGGMLPAGFNLTEAH